MLFNYRYVSHDIEKLQKYLDHLVKEVWCKANGVFSVDLLCVELKEIVVSVADNHKIKMKLFEPIRDLFDLFKGLDTNQRNQFIQWYDANNDIEALCANDPHKQPITYAEVALINVTLAAQLKTFYDDLWNRVLTWDIVKSKSGDIKEHYKAFVKVNDEGKCPYCGFGDIKGLHHSKRDAYDHYLPKGTYPFNSVNFKNLAPMCHECNSSYKLEKNPAQHIDPLRKAGVGTRRKAFYSYAATPPNISIELTLLSSDIDKLCPTDIELNFTAPGNEEELEAWKDVFGIEERYKAKCCAKNDGKYWLMQALDECANAGMSVDDMLQKIDRNAKASPLAECNFLKMPFLLACQNVGLV